MRDKLLYISLSIIPSRYANSVHVMKMCSALARNGFEDVELLCMKGGEESPFDFFDVLENYKVTSISTPKNSILRALVYNYNCFKKIFRHKGIVYVRYMYPLLACILFSRKTYLELHGLPTNFIEKFIVKRFFKSSAYCGAIFITSRLKDHYIMTYNLNENDCIVLPDCCDIPPINSLDLDNNFTDIGYVGHLYEGRGMEIILGLAREFSDIKFHIIGGRDQDIERYKLLSSGNIIYHGFVKQNKLFDLYNKFTIALAPYQSAVSNAGNGNSVDWMSPMKMFEYMAYNKVIISSDLPALREIGEDRKDLIFVAHDKLQEWVKVIEELINNPILMSSLRDNSYKKFLNEYTWDKRVVKLNEFIKK